ncbi:MAG: DUF488 domain-containing protein [Acidobacteriaceae bacterium]|nr:DUF488 domain-containing protein [Acidobacteriaceae bacterium]
MRLLRTVDVEVVADIRSVPRSRTNPQYNKDSLREALAALQIEYRDIAELGGLRGKSKTAPPELNGFWENQSFHNYADYALTEPFRIGLLQLITMGRGRRCAMMCSEAVWWRCHRRIVADHLITRGESVFHLIGDDRVVKAKLTEGAQVRDNGEVIYPAKDFSS